MASLPGGESTPTLASGPQTVCSQVGSLLSRSGFETFPALRLLCGLGQAIAFHDILSTECMTPSPQRFLTQILREHFIFLSKKK